MTRPGGRSAPGHGAASGIARHADDAGGTAPKSGAVVRRSSPVDLIGEHPGAAAVRGQSAATPRQSDTADATESA